jgi:hypothetical protein
MRLDDSRRRRWQFMGILGKKITAYEPEQNQLPKRFVTRIVAANDLILVSSLPLALSCAAATV